MSEELSKAQENKLKEAFFLLDHDNDNCISINEIGLLLRALGIFISQEEIEKLKQEFESQGKNVPYDKFKKLYKKKLKTNLTNSDLIDAFKFFDEEDSGQINLNQLKHGLMTLGDPLTAEEMKTLENELDIDERGNIDYNELAEKIFGK